MKENQSEDVGFPVLILSFNRPEFTKRLITALGYYKPSRVYFAVDGPRVGRVDDVGHVMETRELVNSIDWPAEIKTRFSEENLGCKIGISSAIDWFFECEESGIILEDDCIPTTDFFPFVDKMLEKYKNDERIMHISGSSFFPEKPDYSYNHYFSHLPSVWGWATWKTSWSKFRFQEKIESKSAAEDLIASYFSNREISNWFKRYFYESLTPEATVWSTHWIYSIIENDGLAVNPIANLVRNIGFIPNSTHASSESFQIFEGFEFGGLPDTPDPTVAVVNIGLDRLRFRVIKKSDPNLFIGRRIKIRILAWVYRFTPKSLKSVVKIFTTRNEALTRFLQK